MISQPSLAWPVFVFDLGCWGKITREKKFMRTTTPPVLGTTRYWPNSAGDGAVHILITIWVYKDRLGKPLLLNCITRKNDDWLQNLAIISLYVALWPVFSWCALQSIASPAM